MDDNYRVWRPSTGCEMWPDAKWLDQVIRDAVVEYVKEGWFSVDDGVFEFMAGEPCGDAIFSAPMTEVLMYAIEGQTTLGGLVPDGDEEALAKLARYRAILMDAIAKIDHATKTTSSDTP